MSSLFHEYLELLENAIKRMKKEYPDFIVYTMAITTEEDNNLSYISFDSKQKSLNRLQEWENEYSDQLEQGYDLFVPIRQKSIREGRNYYDAGFELFLFEEIVHTAGLDNCYEVLKEFKRTAFERITQELNIDKEFEIHIDTQNMDL